MRCSLLLVVLFSLATKVICASSAVSLMDVTTSSTAFDFPEAIADFLNDSDLQADIALLEKLPETPMNTSEFAKYANVKEEDLTTLFKIFGNLTDSEMGPETEIDRDIDMTDATILKSKPKYPTDPPPLSEEVKSWLKAFDIHIGMPDNRTEQWMQYLDLQADLKEFLTHRKQKDIPELKGYPWGNDGCTKSPQYPLGYPFILACYRHDFAYRSYSYLCKFDHDYRKAADYKFFFDMSRMCSLDPLCYNTAGLYFRVVRAAGRKGRDKCGHPKYKDHPHM